MIDAKSMAAYERAHRLSPGTPRQSRLLPYINGCSIRRCPTRFWDAVVRSAGEEITSQGTNSLQRIRACTNCKLIDARWTLRRCSICLMPQLLTATMPTATTSSPDMRPSRPRPRTLPSKRSSPEQGWIGINWSELFHSRELLYFLVWRDIKVRYKQAVLGAGWVVLQPLFNMILFTLVFGSAAGFNKQLGREWGEIRRIRLCRFLRGSFSPPH